tara:strand:+ start:11963 stop:12214 length:252 start_codon:yes stop_codon:yes gene_type:complete
MGGVKPKVGPKKMRKGGAAKKKPENKRGPTPVPFQAKPFPEKRGVNAPPKAKVKPKRMRSGGAVKKMAKGGAAVRSSCPSKSL